MGWHILLILIGVGSPCPFLAIIGKIFNGSFQPGFSPFPHGNTGQLAGEAPYALGTELVTMGANQGAHVIRHRIRVTSEPRRSRHLIGNVGHWLHHQVHRQSILFTGNGPVRFLPADPECID
jgi:hypothetical protein